MQERHGWGFRTPRHATPRRVMPIYAAIAAGVQRGVCKGVQALLQGPLQLESCTVCLPKPAGRAADATQVSSVSSREVAHGTCALVRGRASLKQAGGGAIGCGWVTSVRANRAHSLLWAVTKSGPTPTAARAQMYAGLACFWDLNALLGSSMQILGARAVTDGCHLQRRAAAEALLPRHAVLWSCGAVLPHPAP